MLTRWLRDRRGWLRHGPTLAAGTLAALVLAGAAHPAVKAPLEPGNNGRRVCDAQWLLSGHNALHIRTYRYPLVGKPAGCLYGPRTVAATREMKYRLGYPAGKIDGRFGRNLRDLLLGKTKLPPLYAVRRASRHPLYTLKVSYPLANRAAICGGPGGGTHSYTAPPDNWQSDQAVDLCAAEGTPILAVRAGTICQALGALYPGSQGRFGGIRFYLCDDTGNRWYYQHARQVATGLHLGSRVHAGQTIAYVGVAGVAHLHLACQRGCRTFAGFQSILGVTL